MRAFHFFLGGADLEMLEIRRLLEAQGAPFTDRGLAWGAKLSDCRAEIEAADLKGEIAVSIELADDMPPGWPDAGRASLIEIDHHGARAGVDQPSSLRQVFGLLALPESGWTRRMALVAANDIGHVAGMEHIGATPVEIAAIRAEDRAAQGVSADDEEEARRVIAARKIEGRLTVVETRSATSSAVADFMLTQMGGPGYEALLVLTPKAAHFFGPGDAVMRLAKAFPGSWSGGALPPRGFWGVGTADAEARSRARAAVIAALA